VSTSINVESFIDSQGFGRTQVWVVALCALVAMVDGFDAQLIAFVAPAFSAVLHIDRSALGPVFSAGLIGMAVGSLASGPIADRIGRKPVILLSLGWFGIWSLLTASADSATTLIILRFMTGLGCGAAMPNATALTAEYGQKQYRATMVTVMYCGFSIGAALGGPLTDYLLRFFPWWSVFIFGGCTPLIITVLILIRLPESLRFLVVNNKARKRIEGAMRFVQPHFILEPTSTVTVEETERHERQPVRQLFAHGRRGSTLLLWLMFGMGYLDLYLLNSWLPTIMHGNGIDIHAALLITSGFQTGGLIGTLLLGRVIDRLEPSAVLGAIFIAGTACIFLIGNAGTSVALLSVAVFAAGACVISGLIGLTAVAAALYPTAIRSTGIGWAIGTGRVGGIIGPVLGGLALSLKLPPQSVFQIAAAPCLLAAAAAIGMTLHNKRQINHAKVAAR
jgi:MFS transporter, AAHS family, 4-hydroxybenzoate transporter